MFRAPSSISFSCNRCKPCPLAEGLESSVSLSRPDGVLHGSLIIPESRLLPPIAILISGSGPTDRDGNFPGGKNDSLRQLAFGLSKHGVGTLRFDKRGVGESVSEGFMEEQMTIGAFTEDVVAWVNYLLDQGGFRCITIVGHSEGSLVGMIVAQQTSICGFIIGRWRRHAWRRTS